MEFIFLYIRENIRRRKSNYILPFISFVLGGILLCTSVFYLTLSVEEPPEEVCYYPYQISVKIVDGLHENEIYHALAENEYIRFEGMAESVDLFPAYQREIEEFDPKHSTRHLDASPVCDIHPERVGTRSVLRGVRL